MEPQTTLTAFLRYDDRSLLTPCQASARLAAPVRTLRQWRHLGVGPRYFKLGEGRNAAVRYDPRDIEEWLKRHASDSGAA